MPIRIKKPRCNKGKSCGVTCIDRDKFCLKDASNPLSKGLKKVRFRVKNRGPVLTPGHLDRLDSTARFSVIDSIDVLRELRGDKKAISTDGLEKVRRVNWREILSPDSQVLGRGAYGSFTVMEGDRLAENFSQRFPHGVGVKAGNIGTQEVWALRDLGAKGITPTFIAAKESSRFYEDELGLTGKVRRGVIAMEFINGVPHYNAPQVTRGLDKDIALLTTVANMHRAGYSHNDLHGNNAFVEPSGKVKILDLGLAMALRKSALAEALAIVVNEQYGMVDWRLKSRFDENLYNVKDFLWDKGFSQRQVEQVMDTGVRQNISTFFNGIWRGISSKEAGQMIDLLYDGIV